MSTTGTVTVEQERIKAIADRLRGKYGAQRVILFGSAARGQATEHSDIDLLVITQTDEKFFQRVASVLRTVRDLSYAMPLAPIVLTPEELQSRLARGDQFLQEIMDNGVDV